MHLREGGEAVHGSREETGTRVSGKGEERRKPPDGVCGEAIASCTSARARLRRCSSDS